MILKLATNVLKLIGISYSQAQSKTQLQLDRVSSIITVPVVHPEPTRAEPTWAGKVSSKYLCNLNNIIKKYLNNLIKYLNNLSKYLNNLSKYIQN